MKELPEESRVQEDVQPAYVSAGVTHTGRVRTSNQDAFVDRADVRLWAVADGMGGHMQGDVASRMACDALEHLVPGTSLDRTVTDLERRIGHVNAKLYAASVRLRNPIQSGTTLVAFLAHGSDCAVLWAGDSRLYRLRGGHFIQLTTDHTWAAQMAHHLPPDDPLLEEDHSIMRAVGGEHTLMLDVRRDKVQSGDRYLLCSDGLTRELGTEQIAQHLAKGDVSSSAQSLLDATLRAGARDNVTVVVIDVR